MRRPALATALVFALSGFLFASWVSRLPATRDRLDAGTGALGLALLMSGLGSLIVMPITGRLCTRFGSRRVVMLFSLVGCSSLLALSVVPSVVLLGATLFAFGLVYGAWDVAMNVHGSVVEQRAGKDWMPRYHGAWSVGSVVGAGLGTLAARADIDVRVHFALVAALAAAAILWALGSFVDDRESVAGSRPEGEAGATSSGTRLLTPLLIAVGLVTLCATLIEGSANDWLAIFLADERGAGDGAAAAGFTIYAIAMATGRFAGTPVIAAIGRDRAVRYGGLAATVGVLVAVLGPGLAVGYAGAVLWGLGVAIMFPAAMSAGGEIGGSDGIAAVSTIGYGGFLVGPPLIGLLADQVGLDRALLVPAVLGVAATLLAPAVRQRKGFPEAP